MKKKNFQKDPRYKSLSLFLIGTIGIIMVVYIGFGLVMTTVKVEKLMNDQRMSKRVPSEVGTVRRNIGNDSELGSAKNELDIDVIVKEIFGKITAVNGTIVTVETKIYGDELENVRLKFDGEGDAEIFKYEKNKQDEGVEIEMQLDELEEGMHVGVKLPVEVLLSEIEKDLIYVDDMIVDVEYKEGMEE